MPKSAFCGIIVPRYSILFEESEKTISVTDKTALVFESEFRLVMLVSDYPSIKHVNLRHEFAEILCFQPTLLYGLHNRHDQIPHL